MIQFEIRFRPSFHPNVDIYLMIDGEFAIWELSSDRERWLYETELTVKEIETIPAINPLTIQSSCKFGLDGMLVEIVYTHHSGESAIIEAWSPTKRSNWQAWELLSSIFPLLKRCAIENAPKRLLENVESYLHF